MPNQTPEGSTRNNHATGRASHNQRHPSSTLLEVDIHHHIDKEEAVLVRADGNAVNVQPVPVPPVQPIVPPAPRPVIRVGRRLVQPAWMRTGDYNIGYY